MASMIADECAGLFVLRCDPEVGWSAREELPLRLRQAAGEGSLRAVIVDLGQVAFMNSAGLGALFTLNRLAREAGGRVVLARPGASIRRLLRTVSLPDVIPVAATLDEARRIADDESPAS